MAEAGALFPEAYQDLRHTNVEHSAKIISQLVREHVSDMYQEAFMAQLHAALSSARNSGIDWNTVLNRVHQHLRDAHRAQQS